jgi:hypothetical protein
MRFGLIIRAASAGALIAGMFGMCGLPANGQPTPVSISQAIVQRTLPAPHLDGQCDDLAYQRSGTIRIGSATATARLIHSGIDAYLCFAGLPKVSDGVLVRVDSRDNRQRQVDVQGIYEFRLTRDGRLRVRQANADGSFGQTVLPPEAFAGTVQHDSSTWDAEFRIGLDWLGGYGRSDRFQLAVEQMRRGEEAWPEGSQAGDISSWALLQLDPVYPAQTTAGSAFFDGAGGHLVVPYSSALNPREMTIAAWVRVLDDRCGTILGNGRLESYWLGVCGGLLKFSPGPSSLSFRGQRFLGSSWHHLALTIGADGACAFYVDGTVDRAVAPRRSALGTDGNTHERERPAFRVVPGRSALWIGADRSTPQAVSVPASRNLPAGPASGYRLLRALRQFQSDFATEEACQVRWVRIRCKS